MANQLQASKWLAWTLLVEEELLAKLFCEIPEVAFAPYARVFDPELSYGKEEFLAAYRAYFERCVEAADRKNVELATQLTSVASFDPHAWNVRVLGEHKAILILNEPVIVLRAAKLQFNEKNEVVTEAVSKEAQWFGLRIEYPQLFIDQVHKEVKNGLQDAKNMHLYKQIVRFLRKHSKPVTYTDLRTSLRMQIRSSEKCAQLLHILSGGRLCLASSFQ